MTFILYIFISVSQTLPSFKKKTKKQHKPQYNSNNIKFVSNNHLVSKKVRKLEILVCCLALTLVTGKTQTAAACFIRCVFRCILRWLNFTLFNLLYEMKCLVNIFGLFLLFLFSQRKLILSPLVIFNHLHHASRHSLGPGYLFK